MDRADLTDVMIILAVTGMITAVAVAYLFFSFPGTVAVSLAALGFALLFGVIDDEGGL